MHVIAGSAQAMVTPDLATIQSYVQCILADLRGLVPVRLLPESGSGEPILPYEPVGRGLPDALLRHAVRAADLGYGLYVVPGTVAKRRAKAADVRQLSALLVDLDAGDIASKCAHLVEHLGAASLEVASGGITPEGQRKRHLYWRLDRAAEGADIAVLCGLRGEVARKVAGDLHFESAHQPVRVAGSVHSKEGRRAVEILQLSDRSVGLEWLAKTIAEMPPLAGVEFTGLAGRSRPTATNLMLRKVRAGGVDDTTRFDALSSVIGFWVRRAREGGLTIGEAWLEVVGYNAAAVQPPWPEERLRREFEAIVALDRRRTGCAQEGDQPSQEPVPLSEDALAAEFSRRHAASWRYVQAWGRWLEWTGAVWRVDASGRAVELARQVCRSAAAGASKPDARRISSDKTIRAVERLARSDPRHVAEPADWDADRMRLNTPGGTINLATGELLPHDPAALITRMTRASLGGDSPTWCRFIAEITGDDGELAAYLARVAGYCLTGVSSEQVFFFLHGSGANGKSVLVSALQDALGSYATTAPLDSFMASRGDRHPTDLAGLRGARLVSVTETEPGRAWAESRIKAITGGDTVSVRFMNQNFFEMRPDLKLLIAGNHLPRLSGVGEAMRRRLHLIPFEVTIPPDRRDPGLGEKLAAERDGILGWMLGGCLDWQRLGLAPPRRVLDEASCYFDDEDSVGQWIAEACVTGPEHRATARALYASWAAWAGAAGLQPGSHRDLADHLKARGFRASRTSRARGYLGIAPRSDPSRSGPPDSGGRP